MTALLIKNHLMNGTVRFDDSLSLTKLEEVVFALRSRNPECWTEIQTGVADDGYCFIRFQYKIPDISAETQKIFTDSILQHVREELGICAEAYDRSRSFPKGVIGWSVTLAESLA
jgi:hypothetical protein